MALATALAASLTQPAAAQDDVARGDSLLRSGRVFAAESVYYRAARVSPREPTARLALGRYLIARGAVKVGSVLLEEALFFGGDTTAVSAELAPAYTVLGDFKALAALASAPISSAERRRAEWLAQNLPSVTGPDSALVAFEPSAGDALGIVSIVIGRDTIAASIDPSVRGLWLDLSWSRRADARIFRGSEAAREQSLAAVVPSLRIGAFTLTNVPARLEAQGDARRAKIGLDLLGTFTPTVDPAASRIMLRRGPRPGVRQRTPPPRPMPGGSSRLATLMLPTGLWLFGDTGVFRLASERGRGMLRGARWTLDPKRGHIVVEYK